MKLDLSKHAITFSGVTIEAVGDTFILKADEITVAPWCAASTVSNGVSGLNIQVVAGEAGAELVNLG